jgi:hypothetical protein
MARKQAKNKMETCQRQTLSGTNALTYGCHPCQNHGSLILQYGSHADLIGNTGLHTGV